MALALSRSVEQGSLRARLGLGALGCALALHAAFHGTSAATVLYLGLDAVAAALAWWGAGRNGVRSAAGLIAVGVTLAGVGDLLWTVQSWAGGNSDVSLADVAYLGCYAALGLALFRMAVTGGRSRAQQIDGWIDAVVVLVAALLVIWQLSLAATVADTALPLLTRCVWALYPALDAALIALAFRLVAQRGRRDRRALTVAAGSVCWLGSDLGFSLLADASTASVWLDTGWLVGGLLLALSALQRGAAPRAEAPSVADPAPDRAPGLGRLAICLSTLLVPMGLEGLRDLSDGEGTSAPLLVGTVVLTGLVFLRTARLLRAEAAARALVRSQQRYTAAVAAHSSDAVVVLDLQGRLLSDPTAMAALLGIAAPGDLTSGDLLQLAGVDPAEARIAFGRAVAAGGAVVDIDLRSGGRRWLGVRFADLTGDPDVGGIVLHVTDITERKHAEEALAHHALHDRLTGLANRVLFADRVEQALRRAERVGGSAAVVHLGLDVFKSVNDTFGHSAGDTVLRQVADRLMSCVRADDTVARLGGDEFAVLVEQSGQGSADAEATARRLLETLARPLLLQGRTLPVSASAGIAVGGAGATADSLVRDADIAMEAAKLRGRGRSTVFDPAMRSDVVARRELEKELGGALAAGQFRLVYQPVVRLSDDRIVGFEALLRWHSPVLGAVPPDRFVPVAEDLGLIEEIGAWVLEEACATAAAWRAACPEFADLTMAVNVSAVQVTSTDLPGRITAALAGAGLPSSALVVEITETALVSDPVRAAEVLERLREVGVRIALDDFGTGYSSLAYLREFTVDVLKIDRSFTAGIRTAGELPAILRGLIDLARTLHLELVAEGVEEECQRELLRAAHCEFAQGYLFARPLERADAELMMLEGAPGRVSARQP